MNAELCSGDCLCGQSLPVLFVDCLLCLILHMSIAILLILLHYNTKTGFLILLNELNMIEIPSKQLRSNRTPVHNCKQNISLFKIDFL